jgi:hypothetical protein
MLYPLNQEPRTDVLMKKIIKSRNTVPLILQVLADKILIRGLEKGNNNFLLSTL